MSCGWWHGMPKTVYNPRNESIGQCSQISPFRGVVMSVGIATQQMCLL
jgi:hypothetical protein